MRAWLKTESELLSVLYCLYGLSCREIIPFLNKSCNAIKMKTKKLKLKHSYKQKALSHSRARKRQPKAYTTVKCDYCSEEITIKNCAYKNWEKHFCGRQCYSLFMLLDKNPNWQNGKSFESYSFKWKNQLREKIRDRDCHQCQICGTYEKRLTRKLDVHHIDYDKHNCNETNLISLCRKCHGKTNGNRAMWEILLKEKICNLMTKPALSLIK